MSQSLKVVYGFISHLNLGQGAQYSLQDPQGHHTLPREFQRRHGFFELASQDHLHWV